MLNSLFIGIDMGTSGCRAIAIDADGVEIARCSVALAEPRRDGPRVEQDPGLWWTALCQVTRALMADLPCPPTALAIDGTSGTLVVTDAHGTPLGPGLLYNDARAVDAAARIAAIAPRESGAHGASSSLAKLCWWLDHHDPRAARHALHQADWLAAQLTGRYGISDENNALKLGYDPVARDWPAWLEGLGLPAGLLPRVLPPGDRLGTVTPRAAADSGLPEGLPVLAGTTDSVAAFLATGASQPGEAVTSLGSTLVLKIVSPRPVFAPEFGVYSHRLWDRWLAGGASNSGGAVLKQFFSPEAMAALSSRLEPERTTGLDYYPLPALGERFPVCDPGLAPRLTPRPDDDARFFQGLLEGIAAIEALGYRRLVQLGAPAPTRVRTVGGGSINPAWTRIRERLLGVPLVQATHTDAAYGAALIARKGFGESETRGS
ncbi:carbohydrate kinase FGGY [Thioalkalivibrio sulfidiphilus HL-EbGr7]|uniref:Carbohydrate kinase FGGY n=1 Tax=Thioalkalivibrio sulfidiphilus (strain HL-EbGR7) TaxID=396588 RepID=B8GTL4_THISH|nr:FGGY-family carbohydrate kinase [Thioalkalivibrio sulfidiphilus]ACL73108.1 carbohydrate kinase FGGY [Thioalkalivibrio sulfidiphilus HL-EbGr7]